MALRLRRGTSTVLSTITPAEGELVYTTDTKRLYVGDGATVGGISTNSGYTGSASSGYTGSAGVGFTGSTGAGYTGSAGVGFTGSAATGYTGSAGSSSSLINGSKTASLASTGVLTVTGSIVPDANIAYDLGSATNRFRDIYLSSSTINLGGTAVSVNSSGQLTVSESYIVAPPNVPGISISAYWTTNSLVFLVAIANADKFDSLKVGDKITLLTGEMPANTVLTVTGPATSPKTVIQTSYYVYNIPVNSSPSTVRPSVDSFSITRTTGGTVSSLVNGAKTASLASTGVLTVTGSIVPDANIAYDLGSATNRFRDIYLSSSTINLGGTAVSVNSSGQLSVSESYVNSFPGNVILAFWNPNQFRVTVALALADKFDSLKVGDTITLLTGAAPANTVLTLTGPATGKTLVQGDLYYDYLIPVNSSPSTSTAVVNTFTITRSTGSTVSSLVNGTKTVSLDTDGNLKLPNASELRPSTAAYDAALAGWESIRGGYITTTISNNQATALGWPMVNWYPTGPTAQGYIDFLLNAKTLQDTAGSTLIIQPAMSLAFYLEMRAALIAIRDSYNVNTTAVSLSSAYGKSWTFGTDGKLTAPGNLQVNGGKIILNTGGNAYVESVDYGVNSANSALNIFGGPYQKINLRAGFGTQATWTLGTDGNLTFPDSTTQTGKSITVPVNQVFDFNFLRTSPPGFTNKVSISPGGLTTDSPVAQFHTSGTNKYWTLSSQAKRIEYSESTGHIVFGTATNNGTGASNDIELFAYGADNGVGSVYISAGSTPTNNRWKFDASGTLTVPGSIVGTTTQAVFNTTSTTVNAFGAATTALNIGASNAPITGFAATATTSSTAASLGYLGLPQSATATTATLTIGDAGKHIYVKIAGQTITIPDNSVVPYPIGTTITFIVGSLGPLTIANNDTMRLAGGALTGTRTLAANGMATAVKVASSTWYINGVGLT